MNESDYIDYLRTKDRRNMMSQISQSDIDSADSSNYLASLIGQGAAMLGAGIAGRDPGRVGEQISDTRLYQQRQMDAQRQQQEAIKQSQDLMNPQSEISKRQRMLYGKILGNIPEDVSASDLKDPIVLQGLRQQQLQTQKPVAQKQTAVGQPQAQVKAKQSKNDEIDKEDVKKISAMADLNNNIDNLINSVSAYGRKYIGEEAQNQDDLMYGIAASSGVLKGQGAMTESDIKFWQGVLAPSLTGDKQSYINRMKKKKEEYVKGITKSLELKGNTVIKNDQGKYQIFDKNENYLGEF